MVFLGTVGMALRAVRPASTARKPLMNHALLNAGGGVPTQCRLCFAEAGIAWMAGRTARSAVPTVAVFPRASLILKSRIVVISLLR